MALSRKPIVQHDNPETGADAPPIRSTVVRPPTSTGRGTSGFTLASTEDCYRLIANLQAPEKNGKNHFAFTAPGPIYCQSMDYGLEGVVQKFRRQGKQIYVAEYELEIQPGEARAEQVAESANRVWNKFVADYRDALRSTAKGGTIVWDTGTESWELLRLARFGKLTQIMPHHYGPVNAEYRGLVREAYDFDHTNFCLLHKMKDEWENYVDSQGKEKSKKTGKKEAKMMNDIPFLVQVNVELDRGEDGEFSSTIIDCRQNGELKGMVLTGESSSFPQLAQLVFPESSEKDWI